MVTANAPGPETGLANGWQVRRPDTSWLIPANWVCCNSALAGIEYNLIN